MRHEAIYKVYPECIGITDGVGAYDSNQKLIEIDEVLVQAKIAELQAAEPLRRLREQRNQLLQQTDWRATVDYPNPDKQAWLDYRQALRDLPANSTPALDENGNLTGVEWPVYSEEA